MKTFTKWIVRKFIPDYGNTENPLVRARYGFLEAVTSILINLLLFAVKGVLGVMIGSVALIADAIHTLSDSGTSIIILIGFRIAKKPSDREHPFGHGRAEPIAALIVAVILTVTGIELLKSSGIRIWQPQIKPGQISGSIIIILIGTIVIKELLARFARELGRMIDSKTLEADFWHHRSDALSTLFVLAAMAGAYYDYKYVDGVAGIAVALIVIFSGYIIARDAISPLLGERPSKKLIYLVEETARSLKGVHGVHDVIVHRYGQINLISLHIEVDDTQSVHELHDLSEQVEELLEHQLDCSAVVHIDPLNKDHERYQEIHDAIRIITGQDGRISGFHDLRIVGHGGRTKAIFDITLNENISRSRKETEDIVRQLHTSLAGKLPDIRLVIKTEPRYAYTRPADN